MNATEVEVLREKAARLDRMAEPVAAASAVLLYIARHGVENVRRVDGSVFSVNGGRRIDFQALGEALVAKEGAKALVERKSDLVEILDKRKKETV